MNISRSIAKRSLQSFAGKRLPHHDIDFSVRGIAGDVTIARDEYGIPLIEATEDLDAWFALGFCQQTDRPFQLELLRRVVNGTVSELVGKKGLSIDIISRKIGFAWFSRQQMDSLAPAVKETFQAFVSGINASIEVQPVPHELFLLRSRPERWQVADVLGITKILSLALSGNWETEIVRFQILLQDGAEALEHLDCTYGMQHPVTENLQQQAGECIGIVQDDIDALKNFIHVGGASNNWVVAGNKTKSGSPIFANDPHLSPVTPAHWYLCHISTPTTHVLGGSFVGLPSIMGGRNENSAWGATASRLDQSDIFITTFDHDRVTTEIDGVSVDCTYREEKIRIRGQKEIHDERFLTTPYGPVIAHVPENPNLIMSLRASWLEEGIGEKFSSLAQKENFEDFKGSFENFAGPSLNIVYASKQPGRKKDEIGWFMTGLVPQRKFGMGLLPTDGSNSKNTWGPYIPYGEMPSLKNPKSGFLATANNKPTAEDGKYWLGGDWSEGYRIKRIIDLLGEENDWTVEKTAHMFLDQKCLPFYEVKDFFVAYKKENKDDSIDEMLEMLLAWDGNLHASEVGAAVFELFMFHMGKSISQWHAKNTWEYANGKTYHDLVMTNCMQMTKMSHTVSALLEQNPSWFEGRWSETIDSAFLDTRDILVERCGEESSKWEWGMMRKTRFKHVLGDLPMFGPVFEQNPVSFGGSYNTINMGASNPTDVTGDVIVLPSLRIAVDLDQPFLHYSLPGGQSGNPFSPYFSDAFTYWERGELIPLHFCIDEARKRCFIKQRLVKK